MLCTECFTYRLAVGFVNGQQPCVCCLLRHQQHDEAEARARAWHADRLTIKRGYKAKAKAEQTAVG
jgi:hypothetical protein